MKKYLLIVLLVGICFGQSNEWIYFNQEIDFVWGQPRDFSTSRVNPDGLEYEVILENIRFSDVSKNGKKLLFNSGGTIKIFNTETMDTVSALNAIPSSDFSRFTYDEDIILFTTYVGSHRQLYRYSFIDGSNTLVADSLSLSLNNLVMSPDGQKVVYFKYNEDFDTDSLYVAMDVIIYHLQDQSKNILSTLPLINFEYDVYVTGNYEKYPIWGVDGSIYLSVPDSNDCPQIIKIDSIDGSITQLTDIECSCIYTDNSPNGEGSFEFSLYSSYIMGSHDAGLEKFVYTKCNNFLLEFWVYDIELDESIYLGDSYNNSAFFSLGGHFQTWSSDYSKVAITEWINGGMIAVPGPIRIYDTINPDSLNVIDSLYSSTTPIVWINENNDSPSIEGRWIIPVVESDPGNTMYEFLDGLRYTYYCSDENGCDSTYWNSLDTNDAIPNPNPYIFSNDTLTIDLFFGNTWQHPISFECDGNVVTTGDTTVTWWSSWWRVGYDISECEGQELALTNATKYPETFKLSQNYPNPFNPVTNLSYDLREDSFVSITIYDMLGNVINNLVNTNQSSGYKSVQWNATNIQGQPVSAGVYLYSIEAGDFRQTKKMILLK